MSYHFVSIKNKQMMILVAFVRVCDLVLSEKKGRTNGKENGTNEYGITSAHAQA